MNRKTFHIYRTEELLVLKILYYPMVSMASMQSLSKFQCHFLQKYKKKSKSCMETPKTTNGQSDLKKEE